nr:MAG TPA: hypothetical protein [Caudoviricetes sp.]
MTKNVLRDNKAIVKRIIKGYRDSADNLDSYVFVMFLDSSCVLNFEYKDYKYSYVINGLSLDTDSEDIKVVEHKGKGIICLDTNNIFKLSRLRDDGLLMYPNDISISDLLHNMANLVYKDLLNRFSEFGLLEDLMSFYTSKYGVFCDDLDTFSKLFVKHNKEAFTSMLGDLCSDLSIDKNYYRLAKTVYTNNGLLGLCCMDFETDTLTHAIDFINNIEDLDILTKSITNNKIMFKSIRDCVTNREVLNECIGFVLSYKGKGKNYSYDKSSMIELVC